MGLLGRSTLLGRVGWVLALIVFTKSVEGMEQNQFRIRKTGRHTHRERWSPKVCTEFGERQFAKKNEGKKNY